jgi:adenine-specific DNA glycosylase
MELPVKGRKGAVPEVRGVAVVVRRENPKRNARNATRGAGEVLLMRRPMGGVWEGMWEFPVIGDDVETKSKGAKLKGKRGQGVDVREWVRTELVANAAAVRACGEVVHTLTHRRMVYRVVEVMVEGTAAAGANGMATKLPACREGGRYVEARWVDWAALSRGEAGVPVARVVGKIADAAGEGNK